MPIRVINGLEELRSLVGQQIGLSDWVAISQERIDEFARSTGDQQWIHCDPERAQRESPFGMTIAHGFLTLSLLPLLGREREGIRIDLHPKMGVNYGLNRVRFILPVRSGSRVRSRFVLGEVSEAEGGVQMLFNVTVELEGQSKPALVAESVIRRQFRSGGPL